MTEQEEKKLWGLLSKRYLLWVIKTFGEGKEIQSRSCGGEQKSPGDYVINYGKAGDLLKELEEECQK